MNLTEILGLAATCIGIIGILGKWLFINPLKAFIKEQTYPIQPTANGGRSLPDIAKIVYEIKGCIETLSTQVDRVEGRLDTHIEQHIKGEA